MRHYHTIQNHAESSLYYADCAAAWQKKAGQNEGGPDTLNSSMRIIDSHCHVYPEAIAPKAVEAVNSFYEGLPVSAHLDGTAKTLLKVSREHGIAKCVIHSVATKPSQVSHINRFIAGSARLSGKAFLGLGTLFPGGPDLERDFDELLSLKLQGVKLHPDLQQFHADDPKAMQVYEMCESAGLPVLLHTGDFRLDFSNPARVVNVVKRFPRLKVIGAHFGGWSVWDDAAALLPDFENFYVDTSSSFFWLEPARARQIIRRYGAERVMFGTDYPMWSCEPELVFLQRLQLEQAEMEDICHGTCERLFDT